MVGQGDVEQIGHLWPSRTREHGREVAVLISGDQCAGAGCPFDGAITGVQGRRRCITWDRGGQPEAERGLAVVGEDGAGTRSRWGCPSGSGVGGGDDAGRGFGRKVQGPAPAIAPRGASDQPARMSRHSGCAGLDPEGQHGNTDGSGGVGGGVRRWSRAHGLLRGAKGLGGGFYRGLRAPQTPLLPVNFNDRGAAAVVAAPHLKNRATGRSLKPGQTPSVVWSRAGRRAHPGWLARLRWPGVPLLGRR